MFSQCQIPLSLSLSLCVYTADKSDLRIRENKDKSVYIEGVVEEYVTCAEDVIRVMDTGSANRKVAATSRLSLPHLHWILAFLCSFTCCPPPHKMNIRHEWCEQQVAQYIYLECWTKEPSEWRHHEWQTLSCGSCWLRKSWQNRGFWYIFCLFRPNDISNSLIYKKVKLLMRRKESTSRFLLWVM